MAAEANSTGRDQSSLQLTHARLLGGRLHLHTYVRLVVAVTVIVGALFAEHVIGIEHLDVPALMALGLAIAVYNAVAHLLGRRYRDRELSPSEYGQLLRIMYAAIVLDFLSLTVAVWLVGGSRSPFLIFYLPHVTLSFLLLTRRAALTFTGLAYGLLLLLVIGEWLAVIPPRQPVGAIGGTGAIDGRYAFTVLAVYGMVLVTIAVLLLTLTARLREGERRIREANVELQRLSDMRRDFLHIALHNLQSPIGAITMYLNNIRAGLSGQLGGTHGHWIDRSLRRLEGLNQFLANFRTLNMLESGTIEAEMAEVDVGAMLASLVEEHRETADAHGHDLRLDLARPLPAVHGLERLLREAAVNYITNALKYTPDGGRIVVRAFHAPPHVRIEVEDSGIGIAKADQERLFHEFVRLDRVGTPVAEVKGSGLGLSIVRRVIERHGGRTFVESEPGEGSTFVIELPASAMRTDGAVETVATDGGPSAGADPQLRPQHGQQGVGGERLLEDAVETE